MSGISLQPDLLPQQRCTLLEGRLQQTTPCNGVVTTAPNRAFFFRKTPSSHCKRRALAARRKASANMRERGGLLAGAAGRGLAPKLVHLAAVVVGLYIPCTRV